MKDIVPWVLIRKQDKMVPAATPGEFEKKEPADHNVALVKDETGKVIIRDAYFEHVDDVSLQDARQGIIAKGTLQRDKNTVGIEIDWAFQIPAIAPYPPQQNIEQLKQLVERAERERRI